MNNELLYEVSDGIAVITINRPERKNAQDVAMLYALDDAFRRAAQDSDVRVIILDAAGDTFAYDVNTNTNYNAEAEKRAGVSASLAVAQHLLSLLPRAARAA